ncbi:hypothetical protein LTR62_001261 [Meristemomyces frigidus]|uniref:Uncharacterized protein n=1 Tax=Meristemomyces frigidus TaxID=1508187 RepID=A0AAN7TGE2_9PEZI|nr:hypothetical protein LTR62_001261 [Meristemomyces frigidus]
MATLTASIPLECRICPKKSDFSDVSHLLTHIQSKAHQSRYYTLKVKSNGDAQLNHLLQEYNQWESDNNIDELMAERIDQKEKRTAGRTVSAAPRRGSGGQSSARRTSRLAASRANGRYREVTTSTSSRSTPAAPPRRAARPLRDSVLNPQLEARIKVERISRPDTPGSVYGMQADPMAYFSAQNHGPPAWVGTAYSGTPLKQESFSSGFSEDDDDNFLPQHEPLPALNYATGRCHRNEGNDDVADPYIVGDEWDEIGETTSDVAKLKGLVWPGMAMFDSATPEMRRKRNQKKDYSVIEQLMATSECVEPEEMVFDIEGILRRQRLITGNPEIEDDESLLSGEIEPEPELPKKRLIRRPRPALLEKDRNSGRVTRRRSAGHNGLPAPRRSGRGYYDGTAGEDKDLTYGAPRPKRRSGISIHRDNSGPEITFAQPAQMNDLTSGFRNHFQAPTNNVPRSQGFFDQNAGQRSHQRLPSFTGLTNNTFNNSFRPASNSNLSVQNFASFGGLNHQTLFNNNTFPVSNNALAMAAFHQQYGPGAQQSFADGGLFQAARTQNHPPPAWDNFANFNQDFNVGHGMNGVNDGFQPGTELNPLFFSSNQASPPDDEATVSPPDSERER